MNSERETGDVRSKVTPYGKVLGVTENRDQVRAVCEALRELDVTDVEVLEGVQGFVVLEAWQEAVSHCFLGDMEADIVQRCLDAVRQGSIVFAAVVDSETADRAAEAARKLGASGVVYFGAAVITNY